MFGGNDEMEQVSGTIANLRRLLKSHRDEKKEQLTYINKSLVRFDSITNKDKEITLSYIVRMLYGLRGAIRDKEFSKGVDVIQRIFENLQYCEDEMSDQDIEKVEKDLIFLIAKTLKRGSMVQFQRFDYREERVEAAMLGLLVEGREFYDDSQMGRTMGRIIDLKDANAQDFEDGGEITHDDDSDSNDALWPGKKKKKNKEPRMRHERV